MKAGLARSPWLLAGALAGCSFAPTYKTPSSPTAAAAYQESADWKTAQPLDTKDRGAWWTLFHDPALEALETQAQGANQDLKAAFARLQQARALTRIARADLFPTLTAGAAATRSSAPR